MSAAAETSSGRSNGFSLGFDRFSGVYLWILFIVVFGIWIPSEFLTMSTLHSVASTEAVTGMVALAVLIPLAGGLYNLAVGATANVTGILVVVMMNNHHWSMVPAIILALVVGLLIGVANAVVVVWLKVNSFIATLGMSSILSAVLVIITGDAAPTPPLSTAWNNLTQTTIAGFQVIVLYLLVLAVIIWWFMAHTPAGRYLYAIGGNAEAARLSGVRVNRWSALAMILSSGIAGLAGVFFTSQGGPSLDFGPGLLLPAFAAAFLGSTQFQPGKFNVWGTLLAIYVLATGVQGLELVSGAAWLSDMFNGVALIVAVAMSINRGKPRTRRARAPTGTAGESPPDTGSASVDAEAPQMQVSASHHDG